VPCAEVVVGLPSLDEAIGLLSFLERRDLHDELLPRLFFVGECIGELGAGSGAGSISLSSQASIFGIWGSGSSRAGL